MEAVVNYLPSRERRPEIVKPVIVTALAETDKVVAKPAFLAVTYPVLVIKSVAVTLAGRVSVAV